MAGKPKFSERDILREMRDDPAYARAPSFLLLDEDGKLAGPEVYERYNAEPRRRAIERLKQAARDNAR